MNLLLDCSLLSIGGGIQVGLSVIDKALTCPDLKVSLVCSTKIANQLTPEQVMSLAEFHVLPDAVAVGKFKQGKIIAAIERAIAPDLVFTVFGPSYWKSRAVNLQGFALPKMLYPESRSTYASKVTRWREECTDVLKKALLLRNVDYFVVETEVVKTRLARLLKIAEDRIYVVGNTYSPAFERKYRDLGSGRSRGSLFTIFVPASYYPHKNLEVVPKTAAALKRRGITEARFILTLEPDSAAWARISYLAREAGVASMVSTVGSVPNRDMADQYLLSDAVLCASLTEASTAVFPEAFLTRRPLIVSDRDFSRAMCCEAALYIDPHDPDSIADAVLLLLRDVGARSKLIEAGTRVLSDNYPVPAQKWEQQLSVIRTVAERGRPRSVRMHWS